MTDDLVVTVLRSKGVATVRDGAGSLVGDLYRGGGQWHGDERLVKRTTWRAWETLDAALEDVSISLIKEAE